MTTVQTQPDGGAQHPSGLALDRLIAGQAGAEEQGHVERCARCAARVERMRAHYAAFLERHPAPPALEALQRRAERAPARASDAPGRRWGIGLRLALAGVLAAAAAALVLLVYPTLLAPPDRRGVRVKGDSVIEMAVSREGDSFLYDGQPLGPGDVLAFRYTTHRHFLMLLSLERGGRVNVYLTDRSGERSMRVAPGRRVKLGKGVELDDYVGAELVIALLSNEPLDVDSVRQAVRDAIAGLPAARRDTLDLGPLPLEGDQFMWLIDKVRR